jgi:hypothetical protein
VISDEDLRKAGLFDENTDIYNFDPELMFYRKEHEPKK